MSPGDRKFIWWTVLIIAVGVCAISGYCITFVLAFHLHDLPYKRLLPVYVGWFAINAALAAVSIRSLRRCYAEEPPDWTGRWQLSLSDLIFIAVFTGLVMAACSTLQHDEPGYSSRDHFLYEGAPISLGAGLSYAISILLVSRMGLFKWPPERWLVAFAWLIIGWFAVACGALVQAFVVFTLFYRR